MIEFQLWTNGRNVGMFEGLILPRIGECVSFDDKEFKVTAIVHYLPSVKALNKPHTRLYIKVI